MGCTDQEITSTVISSMTPCLTLGTVLETKSNLSLASTILRGIFSLQNTYDLCNTMLAIIQFPEETVYSFAMRCLEISRKFFCSLWQT